MWSHVPPCSDLSTEPALRLESTQTVQAARDLATLLDVPVEEAVDVALQAQLRRERAMHPSPEERLRAIHEFVSSLAQLPVSSEHEVGADPGSASGDD